MLDTRGPSEQLPHGTWLAPSGRELSTEVTDEGATKAGVKDADPIRVEPFPFGLGPPARCPFTVSFLGGGVSLLKQTKEKKGALILISLPEDLVGG